MLDETVGARYAEALFEMASGMTQVAQVDEELKRMVDAYHREPALTRALAAPNVPDAVKKDIVRRVFGVGYSPLVVNFLYVMVDNRRGASLPAAAQAFHEMRLAHEGQVKAEVETAVEVAPDVRAQVEQQVSKHTGRQAILDWKTNPAILGGVVIRIKDHLIDYSLQRQLQDIKERMLRTS